MVAVALNFVLSTCLLAAADQLPAGAAPDPRESLETAVPAAIRLLEAQDYATFLKTYVDPEALKHVTKDTPLAEAAKIFGERKSPRLLKVLQAIRGTQPIIDPAGDKATFKLKEEVEGKEAIVWMKKDKYWYIQN